MEFSSHYDFVILGEHPAGLWAARHLLTLEKKVLILPLGVDSGLNAAPSRVLRDFGWTETDWVDRSIEPIQILTPNRRFKLGQSYEELEAEYEFQFGIKPGASVSPEILRGLAYLARGSETGPAFADEFKTWALRAQETVYLEKEAGYLGRRMLRYLADHGAHISRPGQLKQIFIDKKAIAGVQLEGASRMISTRTAIISAHFDYVKGFMNDSFPSVSEPIGWNFDLHFEVSPSTLPPGLSRRMIYVESGAPILEIIQESPGHFHLRTPLPMGEQSLQRSFQRRLCERMIRVCERIIPDLEYNLRRITPDLRDPEKTESVDLPRLHPFDEIHRVPLNRVFYASNKALGFQSAIGQMFLVGDESNPRLGIRGAYQAAIQTFEALNKRDQVNHYLSNSIVNEIH